jgi:hypothetical protein
LYCHQSRKPFEPWYRVLQMTKRADGRRPEERRDTERTRWSTAVTAFSPAKAIVDFFAAACSLSTVWSLPPTQVHRSRSYASA